MDDKTLDERESLELIARMIRNSKRNLERGRGNLFLLWGYLTVGVTALVGLMLYLTMQPLWNWGWFLIPAAGFPLAHWAGRKWERGVKTYTDRVIEGVWRVTGSLCMGGVIVFAALTGRWAMVLPLALILTTVGTSITGIVLREKALTWCPLFGFFCGLYLLAAMFRGPFTLGDLALFGGAFVVSMVVPGHLLNRKACAPCSGN